MTAPRYLIGASVQDWYQMGLDARESALDAFGDIASLPPDLSAWQFVLDNPEIFGDCEEWPKDFPAAMPRDFRAAYNSGEVAHA